MRTSRIGTLTAAALGMALSADAAAEGPKVLFLSTSESFAHGPIVRKDGEPSVADTVLGKLVEGIGGTFTTTKDASAVNAENLKQYDLVIFYTQGDLTKPNKVGAPVMGENGVAELIAWIEDGGGFLGFHSATDTLRTEDPDPTPYVSMIGAAFRTHGDQFTGTVRVVSPDHPTMAHVPKDWQVHDEWYAFRKFNTKTMHVLALMDPGDERAKQEMYDTPPYPVVWCSAPGKGRVYFSALGHREDLWEKNTTFLDTIVDALHWAMGEGEALADPNYDQVVPEDASSAKDDDSRKER